jgi:hypothetical protein
MSDSDDLVLYYQGMKEHLHLPWRVHWHGGKAYILNAKGWNLAEFTIGSGPQCELAVRAANLYPVVIAERDAAIARAEAAEALLLEKDKTFTEMLAATTCQRHVNVPLSEFFKKEIEAGCLQCQQERAERAEEALKEIEALCDCEASRNIHLATLIYRIRDRIALSREVQAAHDAGKDGPK